MTTSSSARSTSTRIHIAWWVAVTVFVLLFVVGGPFEPLLLGWLYFPLRVFPKISPDWSSVSLGCVCLAAFVAVLHTTIRWFQSELAKSRVLDRVWSFRSTTAVGLTILLLFGVGTAIVGATHQFIWLISGKPGHSVDEEAEQQRKIVSLFSYLGQDYQSSGKTRQKTNLKMTGWALGNYTDTYMVLPSGGTMDCDGTMMHGWAIALSGFSGYSTYKVDYTIPWNREPNDHLYKCQLYEFVNPCLSAPIFDEQGFGLAHIAANLHVFPIRMVDRRSGRRTDATDVLIGKAAGTNAKSVPTYAAKVNSNTLLIGTVADRFKPWAHPANIRDPAAGINRTPGGFGGPPSWKGAMFLKQDGSVEMVSEKIDPHVLKALSGNSPKNE